MSTMMNFPAKVITSLAAANENYRDRFARATTPFEGAPGLYDVTIRALGELDGDGEFRFLINGEVVASATNAPTDTDYEPQHHTFTSIDIPANALLGVESVAVSNGLIPEGEAFAYARGRWTALSLTTVDAVTPDPVDNIDVSVAINSRTTDNYNTHEYDLEVQNFSSDTTATNVSLTIEHDNDLDVSVNADYCQSPSNLQLVCTLAEIAPGESVELIASVTAAASVENYTFTAQITADQTDNQTTNNSASIETTIVAPEPEPDTQTEPNPDTQTEPNPDTQTEPSPDTQTEPESQTQVPDTDNTNQGATDQGPAETQTATNSTPMTTQSGGGTLPMWLVVILGLTGGTIKIVRARSINRAKSPA